MKKISFLFLISFTILKNSDAQGTWTQKADFGGNGRFVAAAFSIGAKGYIGTGRDAGAGFSNDFWEWDQLSNVWTQKADFGGTQRMAAVGFSIDSLGYIGTGWDINLVFTQDFWEYDPLGNAWTQKAPFPGIGRYRAAGFSIGTRGYIGTGYNGSVYMNDFWEWDQTTDTWSQKTDFPGAARLSPAGFSIGTKGYMGTGGDGNFTANYNDFYEWDQVNNTWTQIADFPGAARMGASAFAIGCRGYVGSGIGISATSYSDFYVYIPSTNSWIQKADYGGGLEAQAVGFSIGDYGYIGTGQGNGNGFWEFTPDTLCVFGANAFSVTDTTLCEKFCTDYQDLSTNNPTSWLWEFPGANDTSSALQNPTGICYDVAGTFDVILITTNANGTDTLILPNFITGYSARPTPTITTNGNILTSSPALTYQWLMNGYPIPGATNQSITGTIAALYTVVITDANGCTSQENIDFHPVVGINSISSPAISIIFNPANNHLTVELPNNEEATLQIINLLGQIVFSGNMNEMKKEIDISNFAQGMYIITLNTPSQKLQGKFLKQ